MFDPWFEKNSAHVVRLVPPAASPASFRRCDAVFVSHEHFDHCSPRDVQVICERTQAHVVGPEPALALLEVNPRLKVAVSAGDAFNLLGLDLEVVEAKHPQSEEPVGFLVRGEGKTIYFAGDTYDFSGMNRIECDLAMLPIGGTYTMDVLSAVKALKLMRAKYVIPMHFNTFARIEADPKDFAKRVKAETKTVPVVLEPGEGFTV